MNQIIQLKNKSKEELVQIAHALQVLAEKQRYHRIDTVFPDSGPYRRELYPKHIKYIEATKNHKQVIFMAGNRIGKTTVGAYIMACWLTGRYPKWWPGKRFLMPINVVVAGKTAQTTRDILQASLVGLAHDLGTGLIPKEWIGKAAPKHAIPGALDYIYIPHITGGESRILFKSYDQEFDRIAGLTLHAAWIDEEPPLNFYTECLARMVTTKGVLLCTCTPDFGLTDTILSFLDEGQIREGSKGSKFLITVSIRDVPHISKEDADDFESSLPPHIRSAKVDGIPAVGSGAVYPVPESAFVIDPFIMPQHWSRFAAMDVGWAHATACLWFAYDADNDTFYIYDEYKQSKLEVAAHIQAMRHKGIWMPFVVDPAINKTLDSHNLLTIWRRYGLDLNFANNAVQAGITECYQRLVDGRLKIFSNLNELRTELRLYRYNDKGNIVKSRDDLVDSMRYGVMSGSPLAISYDEYETTKLLQKGCTFYNLEGTGKSEITGY